MFLLIAGDGTKQVQKKKAENHSVKQVSSDLHLTAFVPFFSNNSSSVLFLQLVELFFHA